MNAVPQLPKGSDVSAACACMRFGPRVAVKIDSERKILRTPGPHADTDHGQLRRGIVPFHTARTKRLHFNALPCSDCA